MNDSVQDAKPWYRSRTLWFNMLMAALAVAEINFGMLRPLFGEDETVFKAFSFALMAGNAALRVITSSGVRFGS